MSDLAFRRHILVQTLILIDFLLSLRSKIKAKLADLNPSNKSVLYAHTLSEEDVRQSAHDVPMKRPADKVRRGRHGSLTL